MSSQTSHVQASNSSPGAILISSINSQAVCITASTIDQTIFALKANNSSYSEAFQTAYAFYIYPPTAFPVYPVQKPLDVALHTDVLFELLTYSGRPANEAACRLLMEIGLAVGWRVRRLGKETSRESEVWKGKGKGKGWQKYAGKHKDKLEIAEVKPSSSSKKPVAGSRQPAKRKHTQRGPSHNDERHGAKRQCTHSPIWPASEYETVKHDVSMPDKLNDDNDQVGIVVKHPRSEILGASYFVLRGNFIEMPTVSLANRKTGIPVGSANVVLGASYFAQSIPAHDKNQR